MKRLDLVGLRFGRLTVVKREGMDNTRKNTTWLCLCDCGNTVVASTCHLKTGHTKSCGCYKGKAEGCVATQFKTKHGISRSRIYRILHGMKQRCTNPNAPKYHLYGGRGIRVCEEWYNDVQAFYNWAVSHGYVDGLTIDRIDNDKGYEPSNCRWVTIAEQNRNRRCVKKK